MTFKDKLQLIPAMKAESIENAIEQSDYNGFANFFEIPINSTTYRCAVYKRPDGHVVVYDDDCASVSDSFMPMWETPQFKEFFLFFATRGIIVIGLMKMLSDSIEDLESQRHRFVEEYKYLAPTIEKIIGMVTDS